MRRSVLSAVKSAVLMALVLLSLLVVATPASALEVPHLSGRVVDLAGIIPDATRQSIEAKLQALEARTGAQVALLTVPSLERESLEEFTIRVVDTWQLGQNDRDNGVLLFVAQKERRLRLEVGYGLEGALNDALSRRILDNIVTPAFRQGDFGGGLDRAVDAIIAVISGEGEPPGLQSQEQKSDFGGCLIVGFFLLFFVILPTLSGFLRASHHKGGWSSRRGWAAPWIIDYGSGKSGRGWGGGSGGSFGGFSGGGGGFGGGGASGGW